MKKGMMTMVAVLLLGIAACAPKATVISRHTPPVGWVPVHIENPDLLPQEICFFEGGTPVRIIPDNERGGWKYSRPAFVCYEVSGANSEGAWHEYSELFLPRDMEFVAAARVNGLLGQGEPYFQYFRTGGNPYALTYVSVTPTRRYVNCGGLVRLRRRQPSGARRLDVRVDMDARPLGAAAAEIAEDFLKGNFENK